MSLLARIGYNPRQETPIPSSGDITRLLQDVARGDKNAEADLIPLVYNELRRLARRYMRVEAAGHTLQTTAVVHEAYIRLAGPGRVDWQSRTHFFAVAATVMRRVLVDHARAQRAEKRGGKAAIEVLEDEPAAAAVNVDQMIALDAALDRLAALDPRQCRIVELRFFAGLSIEETAEVVGTSPRTVKRDWQLARAWLLDQLAGDNRPD